MLHNVAELGISSGSSLFAQVPILSFLVLKGLTNNADSIRLLFLKQSDQGLHLFVNPKRSTQWIKDMIAEF